MSLMQLTRFKQFSVCVCKITKKSTRELLSFVLFSASGEAPSSMSFSRSTMWKAWFGSISVSGVSEKYSMYLECVTKCESRSSLWCEMTRKVHDNIEIFYTRKNHIHSINSKWTAIITPSSRKKSRKITFQFQKDSSCGSVSLRRRRSRWCLTSGEFSLTIWMWTTFGVGEWRDEMMAGNEFVVVADSEPATIYVNVFLSLKIKNVLKLEIMSAKRGTIHSP